MAKGNRKAAVKATKAEKESTKEELLEENKKLKEMNQELANLVVQCKQEMVNSLEHIILRMDKYNAGVKKSDLAE